MPTFLWDTQPFPLAGRSCRHHRSMDLLGGDSQCSKTMELETPATEMGQARAPCLVARVRLPREVRQRGQGSLAEDEWAQLEIWLADGVPAAAEPVPRIWGWVGYPFSDTLVSKIFSSPWRPV